VGERPEIGDIVRRAAQTNLRFVEDIVELSLSYVRSLPDIFDGTEDSSHAGPEQSVPPAQGPAALVLEAEAGAKALGHILVENKLSRGTSCDIEVSPVVDTAGADIREKVSVEPSSVILESGEKVVVRVTAEIDDDIKPGVAYRGSISAPGLSDAPAHMVVRRLQKTDAIGDIVTEAPRGVSKKASKKAPAKARRRASTRSKPK
jgi:hypothetical protein